VLGYVLRTKHKCSAGDDKRGIAMDDGATDDNTVFATRRWKELNAIPETSPPLHYNSLMVELGEQIYRYREFVVFHGDQVYP
jgi:hypothetical protein